ncbi:MAG: neutral zinc metallopeptidase [Vicinamibacterales bacterium]
MRWQTGRRSSNVEDRRGMGVGGPVGVGGIGTLLLVLVISFLTGQNPLQLLQLMDNTPAGGTPTEAPTGAPTGDPRAEFVAVVLGDTEEAWTRLFTANGDRYQPPVLVLFEDQVQSACGFASAAVGPFYCPGDQKVYLDLSFFRELDQRFGAPGDFAQAYVVAHEVGHHVQNLLGVGERVDQLRRQMSETQANALSVRQELQADCYAGIWGHHANRKQLLESGDVEEGMQAAAAIGDDRLQRGGRGRVSPETFTHGSSSQRVEWLRRGLASGQVEQCDTFGTSSR